MRKYQISKKECMESIHGVCNGCGRKLKPIETVDNSGNPTFWAGCIKCERFCNGVDKTIWRIARNLVENDKLILYKDILRSENNNEEELEKYLSYQTDRASYVVMEVINEYFKVKKASSDDSPQGKKYPREKIK